VVQRSQGSHLAKAFVHRAGCIQRDSFLSITFLVSDVLHCMLEFLINLLKKTTVIYTLTQLGFLRTYKNETGKAKHEQLKWHVGPHCFCEVFLKGYRFFFSFFFPEDMPGQAWSEQQVTQVRSLCGR